MSTKVPNTQRIVSEIRKLARDCADEAVAECNLDFELFDPLPGDWEAYDELFESYPNTETLSAMHDRGANVFSREYVGRLNEHRLGMVEK